MTHEPPASRRNPLTRFLRWIGEQWRRGGEVDRAVVEGKRTNQANPAPEVDSWVGPDSMPGP
jgi:hypothetical protein